MDTRNGHSHLNPESPSDDAPTADAGSPDPSVLSVPADFYYAVQELKRDIYRAGAREGIGIALAQIDGKDPIPGAAVYNGPHPEELLVFIESVREKLRSEGWEG
jgi:hypothetical protein